MSHITIGHGVKYAKLLDGATSTGASSNTVGMDKLCVRHSVEVVFTGSITVLIIALEGSIDGNTWHELVSHTLTAAEISAKKALFHSIHKGVLRSRCNITTFTGSGAVTSLCAPSDV